MRTITRSTPCHRAPHTFRVSRSLRNLMCA
jgi:hypothetical protein